MSAIAQITSAAGKKAWRLGLKAALLAGALTGAIVLGFTLYAVTMLPSLHPWHLERLDEEFSALRHRDLDFAGYLKQEEKLFAEYRAKVAGWNSRDEAYLFSRFNPDSPVNRLVDGAPHNRSFRLAQTQPKGQALLIHGLTDAPYSARALAESLHARGFDVTVLRLPGHGTLPSMMVEMSHRDWTAAVRIAAREVASRVTPGQPFYIGGYSTGGTLAMQYALDSLDDTALRRPDRVLLISPAIEITRVAALASIIDFFSIIPIPLLEKVRWQNITSEFDPYKFNSFPVNASRQVNRSTRALQESLLRARESGRIRQLPPVVTWQSVVDSTVGSVGVAETLYGQLDGNGHQLVLFDVNRQRVLASVQRPQAGELIERLARHTRRYRLDIVGNADQDTAAIRLRHLAPDGTERTREPDLAWPSNLVSLGHVALPFPPDDPVYGFMPGSGRNGVPSIGSWLLRGENGALTITLGSLTRLRSNPFWSLIDAEVGTLVAADLAPPARP
jgi:alpha-beta hydrolase superfamily lysophospholipase